MNVECRKKIAAARMAIGDNLNTVSGFPYFRAGINALLPVEDSTGTLDTMAVDKYGRMYFNADFVLGLSLHELSAVIVHEAQHILLNHHTRHPLGVDAMKMKMKMKMVEMVAEMVTTKTTLILATRNASMELALALATNRGS